jgi:hypothetical protein
MGPDGTRSQDFAGKDQQQFTWPTDWPGPQDPEPRTCY